MKSNRREFLRTTAAIAAPFVVSSRVLANAPNSKLNHACIGADGMGWSDLNSLSSHDRIEIVAICDVDASRLEKAAAKFPQARRYQDWRELLAQEGDRIDSVNVSVPDHMHAPISLSAMQAGKHVYCQKPLTHEVSEARAMRQVAKRMGVTTQMGNQIQSDAYYRSAVRAIQDGVIGRIREIHAWTGAQFPQRGRPAGKDDVPASLNWDHWLGVAPVRPFKAGVYHPFQWRGWQDFGGGAIGDFGCHILDTPFKALGLTAPTSLKADVPSDWAETPEWNQENWPDWEVIHYEFPGNSLTATPTLPVTWYDGGKQPPLELFGYTNADERPPGSGALFIGEDGKLLLPHVGAPKLLTDPSRSNGTIPNVEGFSHYHAFIDACLGKGETGSNFSYAGPLAEATLLGTIAVRFPGQTLEWNVDEMKVTNHADANRCVTRKYRPGFEV